MLLPKKNTLLPSLIWKKLTTPRGNTVYCLIFTTLVFEAICLPSSIGLSHRLFQVRAGYTLSDTYEQEMGVSQGSILSPVLFSLKINNIVKSVLKMFRSFIFRRRFCPMYTRKVRPKCWETYATVWRQCTGLGLQLWIQIVHHQNSLYALL